MDELYHISKSTFSLGDLIAFTLKYSSIESLLKTFEAISGIDVLSELENLQKDLKEIDVDNLISTDRPLDQWFGNILSSHITNI